MTIRWKLNLSIGALIAVFMAAAGFSIWAVSANARATRVYSRMRDLSQSTADLRTQIYQQIAWASGSLQPTEVVSVPDWLSAMLDHIDIQIRLAENDYERDLWQRVHGEAVALGGQLSKHTLDGVDEIVQQAERDLQELRSYYDLAQSRSIATTAMASFTAQAAIGLACVITVLLFLLDLIMVRHWLVRPISVLKASAEIIGQGRLDHRVPLTGQDELAQLARRIDAMAEGLAVHQAALLKARELSALGELCANVAHGLRNPLAALRAGAELAERRTGDAEGARALIHEVAQQVERMDERITRLFQFSRPSELRPRQTSFATVARAARAQAMPLLKARGIELAIEDSTGDGEWNVDDEQLAQSLAELVTNAAHHSPDGAGIVLRGERIPSNNGTGPALRIDVIDQGKGMSVATQEKAFDLFFTSRPEGTGMGLALVRRFVEHSGGVVSIESTPGRGTTVRVALPGRSPGTNGH